MDEHEQHEQPVERDGEDARRPRCRCITGHGHSVEHEQHEPGGRGEVRRGRGTATITV